MNKNPYRFMCDDLERAERNRRIVKEGLYTHYWDWLARLPRNAPLPTYSGAESY